MKKSVFITLVICSIILSIIYGFYSFKQELNRKKLPVLGKVNSFTLTDTNGNAFGSEQLNKRVWVADFFFTSCGDICPIMTKNMAELNRTFEQIKGVKLVSITVNPENDDVAHLKEFAEEQGANNNVWHFLTGERDNIRDIVLNSFKLGKIDEPIFHSPNFVLVDRHHLIRGYYDGTKQAEVNKLFIDATSLLKER